MTREGVLGKAHELVGAKQTNTWAVAPATASHSAGIISRLSARKSEEAPAARPHVLQP